MVTRRQVELSARKLIGATWHHQGRSIEKGIDCIGGILFVAQDVGYMSKELIQEIDVLDYSRTPDTFSTLVTLLGVYFNEIPLSQVREGDVLAFRMPKEKQTSHVGTVVRGVREYCLIHSLLNRATCEEPLRRWFGLATHCFRFKDIID